MKSKIFMTCCLILLAGWLVAFSIVVPDYSIRYTSEYAYLTGDDVMYTSEAGAPQLVLASGYAQIPSNHRVINVIITPLETKIIKLSVPLIPTGPVNALSFIDKEQIAIIDEEKYADSSKQTSLDNYGTARLSGRRLAYFSYYPIRYDHALLSLEIITRADVQIQTEMDEQVTNFAENQVSNDILTYLDIETNRDVIISKQLIVCPDSLIATYQILADWRKKQGYDVIITSLEDIYANYPGIDNADKLRNAIIALHENHNIDYLTLGGDEAQIPHRQLFAFDCEFGAYDDENDIPADMYYGGLDGSWDANNNGIYGEDDDEPDYYPEIYVSRLSINNSADLENYLNRLISYEAGAVEADYYQLSGLTQDLWEGNRSYRCQNYIYDKYFAGAAVNHLYGNDCDELNAYNLLNAGANIVQHTGHASRTVLGLEDGYIRHLMVEQLSNEWGGLFYSIGCWALAGDYDSIGEALVVTPQKGFLGMIGNSRYGWGAPSAAGFGYSEYFQKKTFKILSERKNIQLAKLHALAKIDFIPFLNGRSVYKWIAYELNAQGDAGYLINLKTPRELQVNMSRDNGIVRGNVTSDENIANVVVTSGSERVNTDANGYFSIQTTTPEISFFIKGYKAKTALLADLDTVRIEIIDNNSGITLSYQAEFINLTAQAYYASDYYWRVEVLSGGATVNSLNETTDTCTVEIGFLNEDALENGSYSQLKFSIYANDNDVELANKVYTIKRQAPVMSLVSTWQNHSESTSINLQNKLELNYELANLGDFNLNINRIELSSDNPHLVVTEGSIIETRIISIDETIVVTDSVYFDHLDTQDAHLELLVDYSPVNNADLHYYLTLTSQISNGLWTWREDFEAVSSFIGNGWQRVDTESNAGVWSLSPRPESTGTYMISSPSMQYQNGMSLSYDYKYTLPMYGGDGYYIILRTSDTADTLAFLGAGGALMPREDALTYIASDWTNVNFEIDDLLLNTPPVGTEFHLEFVFYYPLITLDFNDYGNMPAIGIFIDNLELTKEMLVASEDLVSGVNQQLNVYNYPNPFNPVTHFYIENAAGKRTEIDIYNIRGQCVRTLSAHANDTSNQVITWNGKDTNNNNLGSGVYLYRVQTGKKMRTRKLILLK